MKLVSQAEEHFNRIEAIRYDNPNGGSYAYLQFMAYTREVLSLLRPVEKVEKQLDALEGINWLFNECLAASFTHSQKAIFENKLSYAKQLFDTIRKSLQEAVAEKQEVVLNQAA